MGTFWQVDLVVPPVPGTEVILGRSLHIQVVLKQTVTHITSGAAVNSPHSRAAVLMSCSLYLREEISLLWLSSAGILFSKSTTLGRLEQA